MKSHFIHNIFHHDVLFTCYVYFQEDDVTLNSDEKKVFDLNSYSNYNMLLVCV